jgi:hypothetical protein
MICPDCGKSIRDWRRYRLEPLAEALGLTMAALCREAAVSGSTEQDVRCHGVPRDTAERYALRLGRHPYEIWFEMRDHDVEDHQVACANERCGKVFLPRSARQRYCSTRCQKNAWMRHHYASDTEWAEARKAKSRAYWAAIRDDELAARRTPAGRRYIASTQRRRYQTNEATRERRKADSRAYKARKRAG